MNDTDSRPVAACSLCGAPIYGPGVAPYNAYGTPGVLGVAFACECRLFLQRRVQAEADRIAAGLAPVLTDPKEE